jgi:hypothetical protein
MSRIHTRKQHAAALHDGVVEVAVISILQHNVHVLLGFRHVEARDDVG